MVLFALGGCRELESEVEIITRRNKATLVSRLSLWPTY